MTTWGYSGKDGPKSWAEKFPQAAGSRQSPVDIDTTQVSSDTLHMRGSQPLEWSYRSDSVTRIVNTGFGWRVDVKPDESKLAGGPLHDQHRLAQFHCHWARTSAKGSEHTVDGVPFAAELHLVHWNSDRYESAAEAANQPDGLAVLGVLLKVGNPHPEIQKIVDLIPDVHYKEQEAPILQSINIEKLLPESRHFWTYLGSLTTPPCSESVTWILFKNPIEVSEEQLEAFRTLRSFKHGDEPCCDKHSMIGKNYRPPLPLGNRELRECGVA